MSAAISTAYQAMSDAQMVMFQAFVTHIKAGQDLLGLSGIDWLKGFEAELLAKMAYRESVDTWEVAARVFVAMAQP
jgi:hypothetical protein